MILSCFKDRKRNRATRIAEHIDVRQRSAVTVCQARRRWRGKHESRGEGQGKGQGLAEQGQEPFQEEEQEE